MLNLFQVLHCSEDEQQESGFQLGGMVDIGSNTTQYSEIQPRLLSKVIIDGDKSS